jgi:hypothetical protein
LPEPELLPTVQYADAPLTAILNVLLLDVFSAGPVELVRFASVLV